MVVHSQLGPAPHGLGDLAYRNVLAIDVLDLHGLARLVDRQAEGHRPDVHHGGAGGMPRLAVASLLAGHY